MKCEDFIRQIDAYIDGELDKTQLREMQLHAQECENCSRELELARILQGALHDLDAAVVPPLPAQAAWRNAIRAEAHAKRRRRLYKVCGSVAAALVLVIGCATGIRAFMYGDQPAAPQDIVSTMYVVAADGDSDPAATTGIMPANMRRIESDAAASIKLEADDPNAACESIAALASEFNGYADSANISETSAYITVYVPTDSYEQFVEALGYAGTVTSAQLSGSGDTATVSITIKKR